MNSNQGQKQSNTPQRFVFGHFEIDLARHHLYRSGETKPISIERSSYDLLAYFVQNPQRVLNKDELMRAVWPDRVVSENSLAKSISKLRLCLNDEAGELIQLVRGYGYAFQVEVQVLENTKPIFAPSTRLQLKWWHLVAVVPMIALIWNLSFLTNTESAAGKELIQFPDQMDRLAILPFTVADSNPSLTGTAQGISEQLRLKMHSNFGTYISTFDQIAMFDGDARNRADVMSQLEANMVVLGELSQSAQQYHLDFELLDFSNQQLGGKTRISKPTAQLKDLIDEAAMYLFMQLGESATRWGYDPNKGRGTSSKKAYEAFVLGHSLQISDAGQHRRAIAAYEEAIKHDPNYADAWVALGGILGAGTGGYADDGVELRNGRKQALVAMDKGISLAPNNAGHYLLRSEMRHLYNHDWQGAEDDLIMAEKLTPTPTPHLLIQRARLAAAMGKLEDALAFNDRAIQIDAFSGARRNKAWHLIALDRCEEAKPLIKSDLQALPFDEHLNFYYAVCEIYDGNPLAALKTLENASPVFRLTGSAIAYFELGDLDNSNRAVENLIIKFPDSAAYQIAEVYAWRNERDLATKWLNHAIDVGDAGIMYIKFDPLLANIRSDPRYSKMLRKLGFDLAQP